MNNKKGQTTVFVIIGIVILIGGILFFVLKDNFKSEPLPSFAEPIEFSFSSCIEEKINSGIKILQTKGGYITNPPFNPGSIYQPFSSELDFVGVEIPYWHYIKGSNIESTQIPTKENMKTQLEKYISSSVMDCGFFEFRNQGYFIDFTEPQVEVLISDDYIDARIKSDLVVSKDSQTYVIRDRSIRVKSNLGALYEEALKIYEKEQKDFFLENYSVDNMRLYLPVDGFEITCSPLTWDGFELYKTYTEMLESNTLLLNNQGRKNDYYDVGIKGDFDLRFIYSSNWPTYFEANPAENDQLIAKPAGNKADLGILGFCYVPYHFVYNIRHPVLIQLTKGDEIFQFPLIVVVDGNVAKKSRANNSGVVIENSKICEEMNLGEIELKIYDSDLKPLDAELSFSCFDSVCDLGKSEKGIYSGKIPQCINGLLVVNKEGYKTEKTILNTVEKTQVSIFLEEEYEKEISLIVGGIKYTEKAMIIFDSDNEYKTILYPNQKKVNLSSGDWEITINLISNTSITLPETEQEQCTTSLREGVLGYMGMTREICQMVKVPKQILTDAIVGGGIVKTSFSLNELKNSNEIEFSGMTKRVPTDLEELRINYALLNSGLLEARLI